jgi:hypothetical protein
VIDDNNDKMQRVLAARLQQCTQPRTPLCDLLYV